MISQAAPNEAQRSFGRIVVLMQNRHNARLVGDFLARQYAVSYALPEADDASAGTFDLCIVDGPSLHANRSRLRTAREQQEPLHLPVLLLTERNDVTLRTKELWQVVDEIMIRPVAKVDLRVRVAAVLRARRLSLEMQRLSGLYAHERHVAQRFQDAALPRDLPRIPGLTLHAFYRPGNAEAQVGGDWYDALALPDGRVVLSVGDVCGSGLEAAVAMAHVRQVIRGVAHLHPDPVMMLDSANRSLNSENQGRMVTAVVAVIDHVVETLTYANAGHLRPLLRMRDGTVRELAGGGLPLGVSHAPNYACSSVSYPDGASLMLYTDGLLEAERDFENAEKRMRAVFAEGLVLDTDDPAAAVHSALLPFSAPDDVAILICSHDERTRTGKRWNWTFDTRSPQEYDAVRDAFAKALKACAASSDAAFSGEVVFAELTGNVVRHAPGRADVIFDCSGSRPILHVLDRGTAFRFAPRLPSNMFSESGRGLFLAASLAEELSVVGRPDGGSHARAVIQSRAQV